MHPKICINIIIYLFLIVSCNGFKFQNFKLMKNRSYRLLSEQNRGDLNDDDESVLLFTKNFEPMEVSKRQKGVNARRFVFFNVLAILLALGANFMGVSSFLMSNTSPEYFRNLNIDELYSIGGFNKYVDKEDAYEFLYPSSWLKDRYIVLAEARDRELPSELRRMKTTQKLRPDAAYGPANGDGKENVSVVKNSVMPGFSLRGTLGDPKTAAQKLLDEAIATKESGKEATLIDAYEVDKDGTLVYIFEFTVRREGTDFFQHSVAAVASRGTELYTLTAVSPENKWVKNEAKVKAIASSFRLKSQHVAPAGFY